MLLVRRLGWLAPSVLPYRTQDKSVEGVVVTFSDVAATAIQEARAYAENIVDTVREPLLVLDPDFRVRSANRSFYELFETRSQETEGRLIYELSNGCWDLPHLRTALSQILAESKLLQDFEVECEVPGLGRRLLLLNGRGVSSQGESRSLILLAMEDATERIRSQKDLVAINEALSREIPERERIERELRESEQRYRLLLQSIKDYAIFMLDREGRVSSWNAGTERMKGYSAAEIIGKHFSCFYDEEDARGGKPAQVLRRAEQNGRYEEQGWRVRKDGSRFWANVRLSALRDENNQLQGFAAMTRNDTERKAAEERMAELSSRILNLQDQERRRIGQELHDSTAQLLAGVAMNLSLVQRASQRLNAPAQRALAECALLIDQCSREIRTLAYLLHPPFLHELGLEPAVRWYVDGFAKRSGIPVEIDVTPGLGRLPQGVETALFRIVQECLTNIHRHSGGSAARIEIDGSADGVHLRVKDNGRGISADELQKLTDEDVPVGVGVMGMRERARQLGGNIEISSGEDGTVVEAKIPLPGGESRNRKGAVIHWEI